MANRARSPLSNEFALLFPVQLHSERIFGGAKRSFASGGLAHIADRCQEKCLKMQLFLSNSPWQAAHRRSVRAFDMIARNLAFIGHYNVSLRTGCLDVERDLVAI